jgi:hypothetical protein
VAEYPFHLAGFVLKKPYMEHKGNRNSIARQIKTRYVSPSDAEFGLKMLMTREPLLQCERLERRAATHIGILELKVANAT